MLQSSYGVESKPNLKKPEQTLKNPLRSATEAMKVQPGRSGRLGRALRGRGRAARTRRKNQALFIIALYRSLKDGRLQKQAELSPRPFEDQEVSKKPEPSEGVQRAQTNQHQPRSNQREIFHLQYLGALRGIRGAGHPKPPRRINVKFFSNNLYPADCTSGAPPEDLSRHGRPAQPQHGPLRSGAGAKKSMPS